MDQGARIKVSQRQRLQLNLQLQASIRVLRADAAGLTRYLEEQAAENPALVLERHLPTVQDWLPRWSGLIPQAGPGVEGAASHAPSLIAHVLAAVDRITPQGRPRRIAFALAEALEPSGWLGTAPDRIALRLGVPLPEVEAVLGLLQGIEPAGLFARDLRDCLRLQAEDAGLADPLMRLVIEHLDLLAAGEIARLARMGKTTEEEVLVRFRAIRGFNPKPGASFAAPAAPVREPDLLLRRVAEGWVVELNRSALPAISVAAGRGRGRGAARGVQRLVESRNATLLRVGQEILRRQTDALDRGLTALAPMTMGDVAEALELHESTVSRVVSGTSVDTPRGTWWLRHLFGAALGEGPGQSGAALKARIAELVAAEDAARPLSDQALVEVLAQGGVTIARRTVAKYREAMDIPPAHRRRTRAADDRKRRLQG